MGEGQFCRRNDVTVKEFLRPWTGAGTNLVAQKLSGHFLLFQPPEVIQSEVGSNIVKSIRVME